MRQPPTMDDFTSPVHHTRVVARLGIWLGAAFPDLLPHRPGQPPAPASDHLAFDIAHTRLGLSRHAGTACGDGGCVCALAVGQDVCRLPPAFRAASGGLAAADARTRFVLLTVGQTLRPLEPLALLAKRHPAQTSQGVPINRTTNAAGIAAVVSEDGWRLNLTGPSGSRNLSYADLLALPQVVVNLPITCVEGWSADARWSGVRVRDLARLVGGSQESFVGVESAERAGAYRRTTLPTAYAQHPDTLLALTINGQRLPRDHGFPARITAPNRPGVLQTKWVKALTVST